MAYTLVTLEEAKAHLFVSDEGFDAAYLLQRDSDILRKVEEASDSIYRYIGANADTGWQDGSVEVPGVVRRAVLVLLTHIHENRGNDMKADAAVWDAIGRILAQTRDPVIA